MVSRDYRAQTYRELSTQYETLTRRLGAVDKDLGLATEELEKQVLQERRQELADQREHIALQMSELEQQPEDKPPVEPKATRSRKTVVEYDELTKMLYEIRSDVVIIKDSLSRYEKRLSQIEERFPAATELSGIPVHVIYIMVFGGIAALVLMALISGQIKLPG